MNQDLQAVVPDAGAMGDGEMRQVKVGDADVLLLRVGDTFHALGATCTHLGAPLAKGVLHGERLICPWHHACFKASSGEVLEPPALNDLPHYSVSRQGNAVMITVPGQATEPKTPPAATETPEGDTRTFVVLGGGAAGQAAVERLRQENFTGKIILLTREERVPYDRTALSKNYLAGKSKPEKLPLRSDEYYVQHGIDVQRGREVQRLDVATRSIHFADNSTLHYDALLLASGSVPRPLDVPGAQLGNVELLRSADDADRIIGEAKDAQRVVVVGASFIGLETASSLRGRGLDVTVVAPESVPFEKILGEPIGRMFQALHEEQGVAFRLGKKVKQIDGTDKVSAVVLDDGERLEADLVLAGLGVRPATDYAQGLLLHDDGGVIVDGRLQIADELWAAGDIAHFPEARTGEAIRVEHWRVAQQLGRHAASSMLGSTENFEGVPFFWTQQYGKSLRYVGHAKDWDELITWGDPAKRDFVTFYVKGGRVAAVAGMNHDPELDAVEELMRIGKVPAPDALHEQIDLVGLLKNA